jgi:hypothetical protein
MFKCLFYFVTNWAKEGNSQLIKWLVTIIELILFAFDIPPGIINSPVCDGNTIDNEIFSDNNNDLFVGVIFSSVNGTMVSEYEAE